MTYLRTLWPYAPIVLAETTTMMAIDRYLHGWFASTLSWFMFVSIITTLFICAIHALTIAGAFHENVH